MKRLELMIDPALIRLMRKKNLKFAKRVAVLLLLVGFLSSCKSEELENQQTICYESTDVETPCSIDECYDELDCNYRQVWKELFLEETGFTEEYFSKHVFLCGGTGRGVSTLPGITYYTSAYIRYQVRVGWALIDHLDSFIIQHEDGPFLTKADIKEERIPGKYHAELANHDILKFASLESAMIHLNKQTQVDNLCVSSVYFDPNTGDFILAAKTRLVDFTFSCDNYQFEAYLNLVTGEISTSEAYMCID